MTSTTPDSALAHAVGDLQAALDANDIPDTCRVQLAAVLEWCDRAQAAYVNAQQQIMALQRELAFLRAQQAGILMLLKSTP